MALEAGQEDPVVAPDINAERAPRDREALDDIVREGALVIAQGFGDAGTIRVIRRIYYLAVNHVIELRQPRIRADPQPKRISRLRLMKLGFR